MPDSARRWSTRHVALATGAVLALSACTSARVDLPQATGPVGAVPSASPSRTDPWVDTASTGVPAGTDLRASGPITVTEDDTVIDGLDIEGCVTVDADHVVIRNSRITCDDDGRTVALQVADGARGLVVEHSEIDGSGVVEVGVGWTAFTLRHVDIHGVSDGVRFGHDVTVEDSWIHDMARIGSLHNDALQTTSASTVVIRRNVLDPSNAEEGDRANAAIMLGSETGTKQVLDVLIEDNFLDGGNYSLNIRGDIDAEDIVIRDNTFGNGARYGEVLTPRSVALGTGNVDADGDSVEADRAG